MNVDIETNVLLLEGYGQKVLGKSLELQQDEKNPERWKNVKLLMDLATKIETRLMTLLPSDAPINFQRILIEKEINSGILKKYGFELLKRIKFLQTGPINENRMAEIKSNNATLTNILNRVNIIETKPELIAQELTTNENIDPSEEAQKYLNSFDDVVGKVLEVIDKSKKFDETINEYMEKEQKAKEREEILVSEINKRDMTIMKLKSIITSVQNLSSEVMEEEQVSRKAA